MQDYTSQLLTAINQYDPNDDKTRDHLRDLVCWISDNDDLKRDPVIADLLYIASQKMRVFGYNKLNGFVDNPDVSVGNMDGIGNQAIKELYRSDTDSEIILDQTQKEILDYFQQISPRRLLVSAPTSYGKTFLMREIVFRNRERYKNILLVFPTVALLLENAGVMAWFVKKNNLNYRIIKTVDAVCDDDENKIFVFTPERALQLLAAFPDLKIDFFFFDEIYKIDEDYCNDDAEEYDGQNASGDIVKNIKDQTTFLDEDRGKTFRIALYLLSKQVAEFYLAGPNLSSEHFGTGMNRFIEINSIKVKEISFEPTLRIAVNAYNKSIEEKLPSTLQLPTNAIVPLNSKVNDKIKDIVTYIDTRDYGQTLLYCSSPAKAIEYSNKLSINMGGESRFDSYPDEFKRFIEHIKREYNIHNSVDNWSIIKVLEKGFGIHHGQLPKYIQREILDQFNKNVFPLLFCTTTIVEGVNTDAKNMIILNASKGRKTLSAFDIKNIKGRAGRYHHCFVGRVYYVSKKLAQLEESDEMVLDFATYSDTALGSIDLDNAEYCDLTTNNFKRKAGRDKKTANYLLPHSVFVKNRTISKENQEKLLCILMDDEEFEIFKPLITHSVDVENFLKYAWTKKILELFQKAELIDEQTSKKYFAISFSYYKEGFKGILGHEIDLFNQGKIDSIDKAYFEKGHCFSIRYHKKNTALYYKTQRGKYTDYFQKQIKTVNRNFIQQTGGYFKISPFESINSFAGSRLWRMSNFEYKMCAKVDYKSCFDSIYTHSYAWIIERNTIDSKDANNAHLFLTVDRILQNINGRFSNGIIVGPEFSRMIAEILLQRIDSEVMTSLLEQGLIYNQHYVAFRYVDDIFIFANDQKTIEAFIQTLRQCANKYLLHLNELKLTTDKTPWLPKEWLDKVRVLSDIISSWFFQGKKTDYDKLEDDKRFLVKTEYISVDRLKDEIAVVIKNYSNDKRTVVSFLLSTLLNNISKKKDGYTLFGNNQSGRAFLLIDIAFYIYAFYPSFEQTRKMISIISYLNKEMNFIGDTNTKKKLKTTLGHYSFIFQSGNLPDICDWFPFFAEYGIYMDTDTEKYWIETAKKENNPIILACLLLYTKYNNNLHDEFLKEVENIVIEKINKISSKQQLMYEEFWYVLIFHNCPDISPSTQLLIKKFISSVKPTGTNLPPSGEMKKLLCEFLELESSSGKKPENSFFNWKGSRDFGNMLTYRTYQRTVFKKYRKNTHALYTSLD